MHFFKINRPLSKNERKANSVLMGGGSLVIRNGISGTIMDLYLLTLKANTVSEPQNDIIQLEYVLVD